jgi:hypothetical protein
MQTQLDAQSKQMQAQAQLTLQSRQQVTALEVRLQAQKAAGQEQGGNVAANTTRPQGQAANITRPQQQAAPIATAVQQHGTSPLDMILNGSAGGKPGIQTALVIWNDAKKKKIEQALGKLDAVAFKAVRSMTKLDSGTPNARFLVLAFAQDVPLVQQLLVHLTAAGMRAEFHDSLASPNPSSWAKVSSSNNRSKAAKNSNLAGQAQAGLSKAIAKAGTAGTVQRVHGQCDYYSASVGVCPRGAECRFACYNGPGKP